MREYSDKWKINMQDFLRGLLIAAIVAALTTVQETFAKGIYHLDWSYIGGATATATVAYLLKQFSSTPPKKIKLKSKRIITNY